MHLLVSISSCQADNKQCDSSRAAVKRKALGLIRPVIDNNELPGNDMTYQKVWWSFTLSICLPVVICKIGTIGKLSIFWYCKKPQSWELLYMVINKGQVMFGTCHVRYMYIPFRFQKVRVRYHMTTLVHHIWSMGMSSSVPVVFGTQSTRSSVPVNLCFHCWV